MGDSPNAGAKDPLLSDSSYKQVEHSINGSYGKEIVVPTSPLSEREIVMDLDEPATHFSHLQPEVVPPSTRKELFVDFGILLPLMLWAQIGFTFFTSAVTVKSVENPAKRYLYWYLSDTQQDNFSYGLEIVARILGWADAGLAIITIIDIKPKRVTFTREFKKGYASWQAGKIGNFFFFWNLVWFFASFMPDALSPFTGLAMNDYSGAFLYISGPTMFLGQMIVLIFMDVRYIFSTAQTLTDFYHLPKLEKKQILTRLWNNKDGRAISTRTVANMLTRSIRFYGMATLNHEYLFGNTILHYPFAYIAAVSISYRVFVTQSINDYRLIFIQNAHIPTQEELGVEKWYSKAFRLVAVPGLVLLCIGSFLLRTLSAPALYTGPVDDPATNFDTQDAVLSVLGLILGGFSSYQFVRFMWTVGILAVYNIVKSLNGAGKNNDDDNIKDKDNKDNFLINGKAHTTDVTKIQQNGNYESDHSSINT